MTSPSNDPTSLVQCPALHPGRLVSCMHSSTSPRQGWRARSHSAMILARNTCFGAAPAHSSTSRSYWRQKLGTTRALFVEALVHLIIEVCAHNASLETPVILGATRAGHPQLLELGECKRGHRSCVSGAEGRHPRSTPSGNQKSNTRYPTSRHHLRAGRTARTCRFLADSTSGRPGRTRKAQLF